MSVVRAHVLRSKDPNSLSSHNMRMFFFDTCLAAIIIRIGALAQRPLLHQISLLILLPQMTRNRKAMFLRATHAISLLHAHIAMYGFCVGPGPGYR